MVYLKPIKTLIQNEIRRKLAEKCHYIIMQWNSENAKKCNHLKMLKIHKNNKITFQ